MPAELEQWHKNEEVLALLGDYYPEHGAVATLEKLEERFGIKKPKQWVIHYAHKNGIKVTKSTFSELCRKRYLTTLLPITEGCRQIIDGELLGDGCVSQDKARDCFFILQARSAQQVSFTYEGLNCCLRGTRHVRRTPVGFGSYDGRQAAMHLYRSGSHPYLTEQRARWYPNGKKSVPDDLILTPTVLLHWYLGDGTLSRVRGRPTHISLATYCFSEEGNDLLIGKLACLGISSRKQAENVKYKGGVRHYFRIDVRNRSVRDFLALLGPCPYQDMAHKWANLPVWKPPPRELITDEDRIEILELRDSGSHTNTELAKKFGVPHRYLRYLTSQEGRDNTLRGVSPELRGRLGKAKLKGEKGGVLFQKN